MTVAEAALKKFNDGLNKFGQAFVAEELVKLHTQIILELQAGSTMKTVVDTGHLRLNYHITQDEPSKEIIEGTDKGGQATINRAKVEAKNIKAFSIVYLNNQVNYFIYNEEGTERMPARKMVELTLAEVRQKHGF